MKKIIGLVTLAVVLCCNSVLACDVNIVDVQHKQISDIDTSYKVVRSSNGSVIITRIEMPWGYFVKTGIAENLAKDFNVIKDERNGKSFVDPTNNMKHLFMKNIDGATIYIVGDDNAIANFVSDLGKCSRSQFEEVFNK